MIAILRWYSLRLSQSNKFRLSNFRNKYRSLFLTILSMSKALEAEKYIINKIIRYAAILLNFFLLIFLIKSSNVKISSGLTLELTFKLFKYCRYCFFKFLLSNYLYTLKSNITIFIMRQGNKRLVNHKLPIRQSYLKSINWGRYQPDRTPCDPRPFQIKHLKELTILPKLEFPPLLAPLLGQALLLESTYLHQLPLLPL